jgi:hypothetical protein
MIVKDFYIGNTHILIDDACCVKTREEVDKILANIARIVLLDARRYSDQVSNSKT